MALSGCDGGSAGDAADGAPSNHDAAASDGSSHLDGPRADAPCCTIVSDAGRGVGAMSVSCYCAQLGTCWTLAHFTACDISTPYNLTIETYSNCPYITAITDVGWSFHQWTYSGDQRELLGVVFSDNTAATTCDTGKVGKIVAGMDPVAEGCMVAMRRPACADAAPANTPRSDASLESHARARSRHATGYAEGFRSTSHVQNRN